MSITSLPQTSATAHPGRMSLQQIHRSILEAADLPLERAMTLPAEVYTHPAQYEWEVEHLLKRYWVSLAHVSQLPKVGDYIALDVLGEPVVVVRGKDEQIRVLSRTCRHRGMDLMTPSQGIPHEGNARSLLCPYHFWGYALDGRLLGAPEMHKAEGFNRAEVCLHEFRSEVFNGFVFVNLDGQAPQPVSQQYAEFHHEFLHRWSMDEAEMVWSRHWDCAFNWKVLVENFMEAYHQLGSHAKTLEPIMPAKGCWAEPEREHFSVMHLKLSQDICERVEREGRVPGFGLFPKVEKQDHTQWWVMQGFPNLLFFQGPDRFYWYRILPTGPETSSLLTTMFVHRSAKDEPDFEDWLASESQGIIDIHSEDIPACEGVQRGYNSAGYRPGRLSHLEETIWQFQRYLAREIRRRGGD